MTDARASRTALFLVGTFLLASCAQMEPPPGGAVDRQAPVISKMVPADGSVGNGSIDTLTLHFSEKVRPASVLEHLRFDPPRLPRFVSWEGDSSLTLIFWDPFPLDSSICVYLEPGWVDRHGVPQEEWQSGHFASGSTLRQGWLAGRISFKGLASPNLHYQLLDGSGALLREGKPDSRGDFLLRQLVADSSRYSFIAFEDSDRDSLFDPAFDFADTIPDTLLLTEEHPRIFGLALNVIDPEEPGLIKGSISLTDSLPGFLYLYLGSDSLRGVDSLPPPSDPSQMDDSLLAFLACARGSLSTWLREPGDWEIDGVPPGMWWLFAYRDSGGDSVWNPDSEAGYLDAGPRELLPGETLHWPALRFPTVVTADSLAPEEKQN